MSTAVLDQFIDQLAEAVADKLREPQQKQEVVKTAPDFMNKTQVANYLNTSRTTIDRWIKQRNFPSSKVGGKYVYSRQEVDQWIKENTK